MSESGTNLGPLLDSLKDVRSLQYDVDMLTNKVKRYERQAPHLQQDSARKPATGTSRVVAASLPLQDALQVPAGQQPTAALGTRKVTSGTAAAGSVAAASMVDKENLGAVPRRSSRHI